MADQLFKDPITMCLATCAWAEGTTSTLSTTGTVPFLINSKFYSRTALTNQVTPTTDWATGNAFIPIPIPLTTTGLGPGIPAGAAGYACAFLLGFDTSSNLKAIQGPIVACDTAGNPIQAVSLPATLAPIGTPSANNNFCPAGYIAVKLGSTANAAFAFGTSAWSSTGVLTSLDNLAQLTGRPLAGITFT